MTLPNFIKNAALEPKHSLTLGNIETKIIIAMFRSGSIAAKKWGNLTDEQFLDFGRGDDHSGQAMDALTGIYQK